MGRYITQFYDTEVFKQFLLRANNPFFLCLKKVDIPNRRIMTYYYLENPENATYFIVYTKFILIFIKNVLNFYLRRTVTGILY